MSKMTDRLVAKDFGKSFDEKVFDSWKRCVNEHEQAGVVSMILLAIGILLMWVLGGIVGIGLFFALSITGIVLAAPKQSKRKEYQRQLGITNSDVQKAIAAAKKRGNNHSKEQGKRKSI
jgi:hypothetical protein